MTDETTGKVEAIRRVVHELDDLVNPPNTQLEGLIDGNAAVRKLISDLNDKVDALTELLAKVAETTRVTRLQTTIGTELATALYHSANVVQCANNTGTLGWKDPFTFPPSVKIVPVAAILQKFVNNEAADVDEFLGVSCYPGFSSSSEAGQMEARKSLERYIEKVLGFAPRLFHTEKGYFLTEGRHAEEPMDRR